MTIGDHGRYSKPILGEGTQVQIHMSQYVQKGPGGPSKPILGEGTRVHVHISKYDQREPGQAFKTHPG